MVRDRAGDSGPSDELVDSFLTSDNRPKWGALGRGIVGGGLFATIYGVVSGVLAVGTAPSLFVDGVMTAVRTNIDRFLRVLNGELAALWEPAVDFGLFQLPFGVVVLLLVLSVAAWGVRQFR